jgi:hypothetical protein
MAKISTQYIQSTSWQRYHYIYLLHVPDQYKNQIISLPESYILLMDRGRQSLKQKVKGNNMMD